MNNVLFIVGLPGSGKSTLAKKINDDNDNKYKIIDDPTNLEEILPYVYEDLIITDPSLCFEENRRSAVNIIRESNPDIKFDWIFFENNPEACLKNSKIRNQIGPVKKVESFIKNLHSLYTIPLGATTVKVYNKK